MKLVDVVTTGSGILNKKLLWSKTSGTLLSAGSVSQAICPLASQLFDTTSDSCQVVYFLCLFFTWVSIIGRINKMLDTHQGNHVLPWLVPPLPIQIVYRLDLHVSVRFVA